VAIFYGFNLLTFANIFLFVFKEISNDNELELRFNDEDSESDSCSLTYGKKLILKIILLFPRNYTYSFRSGAHGKSAASKKIDFQFSEDGKELSHQKATAS